MKWWVIMGVLPLAIAALSVDYSAEFEERYYTDATFTASCLVFLDANDACEGSAAASKSVVCRIEGIGCFAVCSGLFPVFCSVWIKRAIDGRK